MDVTIKGLNDELDEYKIYWRNEYDRRKTVFLHELDIMLQEYKDETIQIFQAEID
jgi:hypothetical protein